MKTRYILEFQLIPKLVGLFNRGKAELFKVVETGRGLFGVEAACQRFFGCTAGEVDLDDAAALACVLPKPLARTPHTVLNTHTIKHKKIVCDVTNQLEHATDVNLLKGNIR